jgi:hypothetical protein
MMLHLPEHGGQHDQHRYGRATPEPRTLQVSPSVRSTPPTTPNTKKAIAYLAIMPKPMAAPKEFQCYAAEEGRHR